jgi:hypothetical protein
MVLYEVSDLGGPGEQIQSRLIRVRLRNTSALLSILDREATWFGFPSTPATYICFRKPSSQLDSLDHRPLPSN